ncbi:MAG TPA: class I SAM-dependent methyltransferase [Kofleriaceae bacterium]|nr:class I SAM-dependent methyltransferase [Kofleriaceae bacterium]
MAKLPDDLVEDLVDAGSREHYADAALYDYEYRRRRADVTFYRELARRRGAADILELGAGSGRVTIPLARDGHRVVALDQAPAMLDRLRARVAHLPPAVADRITPAHGDLRAFHIAAGPAKAKARRPAARPRQFPLVIAAFNVLEHLYTRGEVTACLQQVAAHLAPGGAFAFDVQLPDLGWLLRDPTRRWAKTRFTDPTTGRPMIYSTNHDYDPISQIALIRLYYEPADSEPRRAAASPHGSGARGRVAGAVAPGGRVVKLSQRKFFPAELEALVAGAGFRVTERYGDFSFRPLDGAAESQVLVCEPTEKPRRKPTIFR